MGKIMKVTNKIIKTTNNLTMRGKMMKQCVLILLTMFSGLFADRCNPDVPEWCYDGSTNQAFAQIEFLEIDGVIAEGDGTGILDVSELCFGTGACDVVAAFIDREDGQGEICVGWQYAAPTYTTIALNGWDGIANFNGLENGEHAYFKVWDASNQSILDVNLSEPLDGWAAFQFLTALGTSTANNIFGCTDSDACNFDSSATADNGSCWSPNAGCSCDYAEGSVTDCAGVCNGSSVLDDCGVCNGGNADQDCAGVCNGDSSLDQCGVCDNDDDNDNESCTGCTNVDADNYSSDNSIDDGTCSFTVPGATNLIASPGPAKILLAWTAPDANFASNAGYTYHVIGAAGDTVKTTTQTSTQISDGIEGTDLYCFRVSTEHNAYGFSDEDTNEDCASPTEVTGPTWRLKLEARVDSYDQFQNTQNPDWLIYDRENYLGTASDASWGYDPVHDIPEPMPPLGPYVSLFFDHPEWAGGFTDHYTEDIVKDNHDFFSTNLTQWDGTIQSNVPGTATITISVDASNDVGGPVPTNYEMYIRLHDGNLDQDSEGNFDGGSSNGTYYRISPNEPTVINFYMSADGHQNFSVFIGNIVPQAPDNLRVLDEDGNATDGIGRYSSIFLDWDEDGADLSDIGNRYPALNYNVYRDDQPNDIDGNLNTYEPGMGVDVDAGTYGAGGCGGLLTGDSGQLNSSYNDNADLYANYQGEGLLQESTYSYTVTGSNLAGESSYGHTVRKSGGSEEYFSGRDSRITATTGSNADPQVQLAYVLSPTTVSGQLANNPTNILTESGELQGLYEIPHNFNPDANRIEISINGSASFDSDYPDQIDRYSWTQVGGNDDLHDVVDVLTNTVTFDVENPHENGDKSYTWKLHVESDHPVKDTGSCGVWTSKISTNTHSDSLTVTIQEEPNEDPVASTALGLIRGADSLSVTTMNDFDDSDFNDYDKVKQAWYEPHDGSGDQNNADLWFSASDSDDGDGECLSEDQTDCDHQTYTWTLTQGALAGFSYDDLNGNGMYEFGEPYTTIGGTEIYETANLGNWVASGPAADSINNTLDIPRDVYTHNEHIAESGSFGYNGLLNTEFNGGGRDLHLSLGSTDSATGTDTAGQEVYILSMTVTDVYGDTDTASLLVLVRDERNDAPTVGQHREQSTYYMRHDEDTRDVYIDFCDNLSAFDTDNDSQDFSWSYTGGGAYDKDGNELNLADFASSYSHSYAQGYDANDVDNTDGWKEMEAWLVEGIHTFTFKTIDGYGATNSTSTIFNILHEPGAKTPTIQIDHTGLKYSIISVQANAWVDDDFDDDLCHGDTYSGTYPDNNTSRLRLYNGNDLIAEWLDNVDGGGLDYTFDDRSNCLDTQTSMSLQSDVATDLLTHIDKSLSAETVFNYTVTAWNSELDNQSDVVLSNSTSTRTHDRPDVVVTTPNGAEIRSVGDTYDVDFITYFDSDGNGSYDAAVDQLTDGQYISKIDVIYLADGSLGAEEEGDSSCLDVGSSATAYHSGCEGQNQSSSNGANVNGCSNPEGGDSSSDSAAAATDCHAGDNTLNYQIADNDGQEVNYNAKVRIRVTDVGDYDGCEQETHEDDSDKPFTMAAHTITNAYANDGWYLVGAPLTPWVDDIKDNFSESLGTWGTDWVAYDVGGAYDHVKLVLGQGYYLALASGDVLVQHGNPIIGDGDAEFNGYAKEGNGGDITLLQGWNLIANPLVNKIDKATLTINDGTGDLLFEDAVDAGWIAPTIYGWFETHYEGFDRLMPFGGYWINTSRGLDIKFRPHHFDDGELTRKAEELVTSTFQLKARDISGNGNGDVITLGLLDNAADEFVYGEDEYDLPREAYSSMGGEYIDMKVSSNLMKDIKSSKYDDFQVWNVSISTEKVDNDIELLWGDVSIFEDDLHIVINGEAIDMHASSSVSIDSGIEEVSIVVGNLDSYMNPVPTEFGLSAAYPNPFNPTTTLGLALSEDGLVSMSVFNVKGQVVDQLINGNMKAGYHNITWDAGIASSGMYFVKVETGSNTAMQKLMLVK